MANFSEGLENLITEFEDVRQSFNHFVKHGDGNKKAFIEYESRFVDLKSRIRPYHSYLVKNSTLYDDKSSTAIKFRIAAAIHRGEHKDFEECTINQAEKYAASSKEYKEFIEKRAFYKESLVNIVDLRDDINSHINLIKDQLK